MMKWHLYILDWLFQDLGIDIIKKKKLMGQAIIIFKIIVLTSNPVYVDINHKG